MQTLVFLFLLIQIQYAFGDETIKRSQLNISNQFSENYTGQTYDLGATFDASPSLKVVSDGDLVRRNYTGDTSITDALLTAGAVWKSEPSYYVEDSVAAATSAEIFAKFSEEIAPHYTFGANDLGLSLKYSVYRDLTAGSISPNFYHSISDTSGFGAAAFFVRADTWLSALQGQYLFSPWAHHSFRVVGAFGRTIEDAGLEASFNSVYLEYGYEMSSRIRVQIFYANYSSTIRNEQSIGIGLGLR